MGLLRRPPLKAVTVLLGAGLVVAVGASIWQAQQSAQDKRLLQGEITDLRYQVSQDRLAATATPTPSPDITPNPSPDASPTPTPVLGDTTQVLTKIISNPSVNGYANLHTGMGASSSVIEKLPNGTSVTLGTSGNGSYQQVTAPDGKTGYVVKSWLK